MSGFPTLQCSLIPSHVGLHEWLHMLLSPWGKKMQIWSRAATGNNPNRLKRNETWAQGTFQHIEQEEEADKNWEVRTAPMEGW